MAEKDDKEKTVRVQFDIPYALYERALPYIKKKGAIGTFGHIAFEEWVKRREGREGRSITQDEKKIREIVRCMKKEGLI